MFEIKETDKGIELDLSNSDEHTKTGIKLRSFTYAFTFDEWFEFTQEVVTLGNKLYLISEPEAELESEPVPWIETEPDLKGRADQIHDALEEFGPLTYAELAEKLDPPVDSKRITRLLSQMIRDGIKLKRFGKPRQVRLK